MLCAQQTEKEKSLFNMDPWNDTEFVTGDRRTNNTLKNNNSGDQNITVLRKTKWYNRTSGVRLTFPWSWENHSASFSFSFFSVKWDNSTNVQGYWGDLGEKTQYKMLGTMPNKCLITTYYFYNDYCWRKNDNIYKTELNHRKGFKFMFHV